LNDGMGAYVASQLVKAMLRKGARVQGARVLVMGLTFKENTPDLRNSRAVDVVRELEGYGLAVEAYDPWVNAAEAEHEMGIVPVAQPEAGAYDAVVITVAHREFAELGADGLRAFGRDPHVLYDLKYLLPRDAADLRL